MHIVLVETTSVRGFDIVEEMADAGIEVTFVAQDLKRHLALHDPLQVKKAARLIEVPQLGEPCNLLEVLKDQWGANAPDGVICRDEVFAPDVARLTNALGIAGETEATARMLGDKSEVRECLDRVGLGSVRWRRAKGNDEAIMAARELGYPLVVKPASGGLSLGVTVVHDERHLVEAMMEAQRKAAVPIGYDPVIMLEEFLPGRLVSAEILVQHGQIFLLGFAERDPCSPGVTAEVGGHFPARFEGLENAETFARDVVRALGIKDSAVHMELMITDHGPELIEINGRVAGHVVMQQMTFALGRSLTMDLVSIAIGRSLAPMSPARETVALRQLWSDKAGTIVAIDPPKGLDGDVLAHGLLVQPGQRVAALRSNRDRFGFVLARGSSAQEAKETASRAAQQILDGVILAAEREGEPSTGAESTLGANETERLNVLLLDRVGGSSWVKSDGTPLLSPERYKVRVISAAKNIGEDDHAAVDTIVPSDVFDHTAVTSIADEMNEVDRVQRVAALSERLLVPAACLRARYAVPGDTLSMVNRFIDKAIMKELARAAHIRCADGLVVHTARDLFELLDRHGQVVVKPRASSGSQGVAVFENEGGARAWLARDFRAGEFLAEAFVPGEMCHIDALVWGGDVIWDVSRYLRDTMAFQRGQPLSSVSVVQPEIRQAARLLLGQVVDAWQVHGAVLHLEAFIGSSGLTFCEVAARPGGAGVVEAFEATRGINLDHAKILIDCGEDPRQLCVEPVAEHSGYTVHYTQGGILESFDDESVAALAYHRRILAKPGERIARSRFSGTGLSTHIFARATHQEVLDLVYLAESEIRFKVRPLAIEEGLQ